MLIVFQNEGEVNFGFSDKMCNDDHKYVVKY